MNGTRVLNINSSMILLRKVIRSQQGQPSGIFLTNPLQEPLTNLDGTIPWTNILLFHEHDQVW